MNEQEVTALPGDDQKPPSILVIEEYIKYAEVAQVKIQESITKLEEQLNMRRKEQLVTKGQMELLQVVHEKIIKAEQNKK